MAPTPPLKSSTLVLALTGALVLLTPAAWADPKTQLAADTKAAQTAYEADRKLCNDETTSAARQQCRRDAKAEYDEALAAAKSRSAAATPAPPQPGATTTPPSATAPATAASAAVACTDCGRVMAVSVTQKAGDASALGVIAGGAIGAVLGNQVGGGFGKDLATLAGAAGGAYAGKIIEEKMKTHTVWSVTVHYPNDSKTSFEFTTDPGLQVGDWVRNSGNTIVRK